MQCDEEEKMSQLCFEHCISIDILLCKKCWKKQLLNLHNCMYSLVS